MNNPLIPNMPDLNGTKIILGVCGGIAAYKSAYLVRELCALGAHVRVVMTRSALSFISPISFQALSGEAARCELFDETAEQAMGHIELARWADYVLIAPASADFLAKMAHGIADDLLSTLYLATKAPVLVCPAMNRNMWSHPATLANCGLLQERGVMMIGPDDGAQACGDIGLGRMADTQDIVAALRLHPIHHFLEGQSVLITAGPTQEAIDPVRYISNHSSGKMGYALAQAARMAGARVVLVSGPTSLAAPLGVQCVRVTTADEMLARVLEYLKPGMIVIAAAAVADYKVLDPQEKKLKRQNQDSLTLTLTRNPDILAAVVASQRAKWVVGFAAETNDVLQHAEEKRRVKGVDMMIANQVNDQLGFGCDNNQVTILSQNDPIILNDAHKTIIAGQIIAVITHALRKTVSRNLNESLNSN